MAIGRAGLVSERLEREAAAGSSSEVDLSPRYLDFRIGDLSGGNQQKAVLARAMQTGAKILLLYDPTRGVDVGTKQSIYAAIRRFAETGGAVLLYSSELPELVHLADRCLVVYGGKFSRNSQAPTSTSAPWSPRSPATRSKTPPHERER